MVAQSPTAVIEDGRTLTNCSYSCQDDRVVAAVVKGATVTVASNAGDASSPVDSNQAALVASEVLHDNERPCTRKLQKK